MGCCKNVHAFCLHFSNPVFRKYLSDPTEDVRVATENLLADILREIRDVTIVSRQLYQQSKPKTPAESIRRSELEGEKLPDLTLENAERALYMMENDEESTHSNQLGGPSEGSDIDDRETGGMRLYWRRFQRLNLYSLDTRSRGQD